MRKGRDGRSRIELKDVDLRAGFQAYRWFWLLWALLLVVWLLSGCSPTHKYSDVPGQDHPYCPPDPRECG